MGWLPRDISNKFSPIDSVVLALLPSLLLHSKIGASQIEANSDHSVIPLTETEATPSIWK